VHGRCTGRENREIERKMMQRVETETVLL